MKNRTILFTAALLFAISPIFAGNSVKSEANDSQIITPQDCGVSYDQIYMYLLAEGYQVTSFMNIEGSCNVMVKTTINKTLIVYVSDSTIEGYDICNL